MSSKLIKSATLLLLVGFLWSCRKGEVSRDGLPDTQISFEAINLSGQNRLNSSVRLSWFGTDIDGFVEGYELSTDGFNWTYTQSQDSVILFEIPPGQDSADIDFFVRAIDNDGNIDPSPAFLEIPLINTPPIASLLDDRGPNDTAFIAATFFWNASDPDGDNTLADVQIKINDGDWVSIDRGQNLISFLPDTSVRNGAALSQIYYGTSTAPAPISIDGLRVNDSNRVYIRALDIAEAVSEVDTSAAFFFRPKGAGIKTLWVSGHNEITTQEYKGYLDANNIDYDLLNWGANQGVSLPKYFDPTVQLIFAQYQNAFLNLPATIFRNPVSGLELPLLDYLAPVIQRFTDRGGKYFLSTLLTNTQDLSQVRSIYPINDKVLSTVPGSQSRITPDSALVPLISGNYPNLQPANVEFNVVPMLASSDAQAFYRAQLTRFRGWNGSSDLVAAIRRDNSGRISQVFFALELHKFDDLAGSVESLIGDIFDNEF
jgi:hypothetical protein